DVCCLTMLRWAQLPEARVLASTLKRVHPDWHLVAVLDGEPAPGLHFDPAAELFDEVVSGPAALQRLLDSGHGKFLVLGPGVVVLNPLTPLADLLETHAIVLVPHSLAADDSDDGGIFTPGCFAFRAGAEGARFAAAWYGQLLHDRKQRSSTG